MSSSTDINLFCHAGHMTPRRLRAVLEALIAVGFDLRDAAAAPAPEAFTLDVPSWHISLFKALGTNWGLAVMLAVNRQDMDDEGRPINSPIEEVNLSTSSHLTSDARPIYGREVMAWTALIASIVSPIYGAAGGDAGGARYDIYDFPRASLASLEPQPLDWVTVYGPPYVSQMGLDRLLSAPAWRSELLADGSVLVALAPHGDLVSQAETLRVARHLDVPQRLHWGERFVGQM
jgi:hypothetical protein